MNKFFVFLCLGMMSEWIFAQSIEFKGKKKLSLEQFKKQFKTHKVDTYNFYTRKSEGFLAFEFNKILNHVYGSKEWRESTSLKVTTTDDYTPLIETYKFKKRKARERGYAPEPNGITMEINVQNYTSIWKNDTLRKNSSAK